MSSCSGGHVSAASFVDKPPVYCSFCCSFCQSWDYVDIACVVTLILLAAGSILIIVGYAIPRDYIFDSTLPAREMEAIEIKHARLGQILDYCIISGMACVVVCALTMACSATAMVCHQQRRSRSRKVVRNPNPNLLSPLAYPYPAHSRSHSNDYGSYSSRGSIGSS